MTGEQKSFREKLGAVFFTFVMITSMVAVGGLTFSLAFSGNASAADAGSDSAGPGTTVNVTAGATSQPIRDSNGVATLNFSETSASEFGSRGQVTLRIPTSSSIQYDTANSSLAASIVGNGSTAASGTNATVDSVTFDSNSPNKRINIDVSGLELDKNENVTVSGLELTVPSTAQDTTLDFSLGAVSASVPLGVERLNAEVSNTNIVRSADQAGPANISIEARDTATIGNTGDGGTLNTTSLHAAGENISVSIPTDAQDKLDFDQSTTPVTAGDGTSFGGSVGNVEFTSPDSFTFSVSGEDINGDEGDEIEFKNVQFNVTGETNSSVDPTFNLELNVTAVPVDAVGSVETQTLSGGNTITATAPTVRIGDGEDDIDLQIGPGNNGAGAGTTDVDMSQDAGGTVQVIDSGTGGEISTNGDVIVEIPNNIGVTFDQRQTIAVEETQGGDDEATSLVNGTPELSNRQITIPIDTASASGDALLIGSADDADDDEDVDSLLFNTTTDSSATNLNLTVTTNGGAADVVQNTSQDPQDNTATSDIDVVAPKIQTNADAADFGGATTNDLVIGTDGDGETQLDPDSASANQFDIGIESGTSGDIASSSEGTNITLTLGASSGITFDQSATPDLSSDTTGPGTDLADDSVDTVNIVDGQTLNITIGQSDASDAGENLDVEDIQYNVSADTNLSTQITATVNRTGVSFAASENINVTTAEADQIQSDADGGTTFGATGTDAADTSLQAGNSQVTRIEVTNATSQGNVPLSNGEFGGAGFSLEVTNTPDGASASDVQLNTTVATTAENGQAAYNVTDFGGVQGDYNVTASLDSNSSVNVTTTYTVSPNSNVAGVSVSPIENSITSRSGDVGNATLFVNATDQFGNRVTGQSTQVTLSTDDVNTGQIVAYDNLAGSGDVSGAAADSLNDGTFNIDTGDGSSVIVINSVNPKDVQITAEAQGQTDSGTVTVFEQIGQLSLSLNQTTVQKNNVVTADTTIQQSDGTAITVPDVTVDYDDNSDANTTFDSDPDSVSAVTDATGTASVNVTAEQNGTSTIDASSNLRSDSATLTIEQQQPPTASVTFDDQSIQNGSTSVNVASARFDGTEDFVIVVHRASPGDNGVVDGTSEINAKIGSSDVLSGNVSDVSVNLTKNLDEGGNTQLTENQTLIAMVHFANESRPGDVNFDNPITRDGTPVFDQAEITIAPESPLEGAAGDFDTDGNGDIEIGELGDAGQAFLDDELTIQELGEIGQEFLS